MSELTPVMQETLDALWSIKTRYPHFVGASAWAIADQAQGHVEKYRFLCVWIFVCLMYIGPANDWQWWSYAIAAVGLLAAASLFTDRRDEAKR